MIRKKVLLLNPPADRLYQNDNYCSFSSKAGYYWPSIDLLVQSGVLGEGFEVSTLDAVAMGLDLERAGRMIRSASPDAIVFVTGTASWKQNFAFVEAVKKAKPMKIVGSGGNLLFEAERFLEKHPFLDAVLTDYTTDAVRRYLEGYEGPIPNLVYRRNGTAVTGPRYGFKDEISYPPPRHDLFPLKRYRLPYARSFPFTRVLTSIGCPFRCSFCVAAHIPYRVRRIENVVEELQALDSLGIHQFDFCDPTFGIDRKRTLELCQTIIALGLNFHWSCNTRVDTVDAERLCMMKKAGCHIVLLGVESGDQRMLDRHYKGITLETIRRAFRLCREAGLEVLAYFIIGLPGETRETAMKTIKLARELDPDYASFDIATPDYGTGLMREAKEKRWIPETLDSFDSTTYPVIDIGTLSKEDVWKLRNLANKSFYLRPRYIWRRLIKVRSLRGVRTLVYMGSNLILNMFRKS